MNRSADTGSRLKRNPHAGARRHFTLEPRPSIRPNYTTCLRLFCPILEIANCRDASAEKIRLPQHSQVAREQTSFLHSARSRRRAHTACVGAVEPAEGLEQVPQGSIYPTGTRFHIPDFSLISGSPGNKASTRSRGPVTRVTCHGNQDSLRLVPARAVACRA